MSLSNASDGGGKEPKNEAAQGSACANGPALSIPVQGGPSETQGSLGDFAFRSPRRAFMVRPTPPGAIKKQSLKTSGRSEIATSRRTFMSREAVIVSTARTGLAKSGRGGFNNTHGAAMGGHAVQHAIARAKIEPGEVEDVVMGCGSPEGATGMNTGRLAAIWAGCPVTTSGFTRQPLLLVGSQLDRHRGGPHPQRRRADHGWRRRRVDLARFHGWHQHQEPHRREAAGDLSGALDADDRNRRHRRQALQRQPRISGRILAPQPEAHRRRPGRRPVQGRNRPDEDQDEDRSTRRRRKSRSSTTRSTEGRVQPSRDDA